MPPATLPSVTAVAPDLDTFPARLKYFINRVAKSQRAFADEIDEAPPNVNNYCRGIQPPASFIAKVARRFPDLNLRWFLLGEGPVTLQEVDLGEAGLASQLFSVYAEAQAGGHAVEISDASRLYSDGGDLVFEIKGRIRAGDKAGQPLRGKG